ncbi:MAG: nicotinate (nicotinamide) nucleotide adenylyltransferase [Endomicrobium sp.]|jgi:nicotinate-nucleotide adenylyltransferase|nr:nicotinate (nicotinamide) nucleotide adenylyltransferase [Endomicrobium sp.]
MSKIAIFGGSFDPVHKAHIQIVQAVLQTLNLKKLIFVIAYIPPHKNKLYANIKDRIAMLSLATKSLNNIEISLHEAKQQSIVYSYQTLDYFQEIYPSDEVLMVLGSDSLVDLSNWKNIDYLTSKYKFIVVKRAGIYVYANTKYFNKCIFIDKEIEDISSTLVRAYLKSDKSKALEILNSNVYEYIFRKGLYQ